MGTIISEGLAEPDDPMFTGRVETFSVRRPKPSLTNAKKSPTDTKQESASTVPPRVKKVQL
jgi:hypothetical protein